MAAISRAMPITDVQSGRFGVMLTSKTQSANPSAEETRSPGLTCAGRIMIPEWSSVSPISSSARSMPWESSPRIRDSLTVTPPLMVLPGRARGTMAPTSRLVAPQTTETVSFPVSSVQSCSRSALGWGLMVRIRAAITSSTDWPTGSSASISSPAIVILPASSWGLIEMSTYSFSQLRLTRITYPIQGSGSRIQDEREEQKMHRTMTRVLHLAHRASCILYPASSLELSQEPHVVPEKELYVVDPILQHRDPLDPETESEPGIDFGVIIHEPVNLGVDHA